MHSVQERPPRWPPAQSIPGARARLLGFLVAVAILGSGVRLTEAQAAPFVTEVVIASSTSGKNQSNPSVVLDPSGVLYVAWDEDVVGNRSVFLTRSTDKGQTFATPVRVANGASGNQTNPALTVDSSGTLFLAWEDRSGGDSDISVAKSTGAWNSFGAPAKASDGLGGSDQIGPSVVLSGGTVYVAYEDRQSDRDIRVAVTPSASLAFGSSVRVNDDAGNAWQEAPSLAVDSANTVYVAWYDRRNVDPLVYISRSANGGATWSTNARVSEASATGPEFEPDVVVHGGRVDVVWQDGRSGVGREIFFASAPASTVAFVASVKVSGGTAAVNRRLPSLAVDPDGTLHVAWQDFRNGVHDVYYAASHDAGLTFAEVRVNRAPGDAVLDKASPDLAAGGGGAVYIVWEDERPNDARVVLAASSSGGGGNGNVGSLLPWVVLAVFVVVAAIALIAWRRRRTANVRAPKKQRGRGGGKGRR